MAKAKPTLESIHILQGLTPGEFEQLSTRCVWRSFKARQQIISHNDDNLDVFLLVQGAARVIIYSLTGKPVIFRDIRQGEIFGEYAAIDRRPRSATVEALSDSTVATMAPAIFWETVLGHEKVNRAMLQLLTSQIRGLSERVLEFSTLAVKNRLHAELLRMADRSTEDDGRALISPMPTHAELAGRISTHREAVTRELNRLVRTGMIERKGDKIVITDIYKLENMVEEVLGEIIM